jgi:hypothetical protein
MSWRRVALRFSSMTHGSSSSWKRLLKEATPCAGFTCSVRPAESYAVASTDPTSVKGFRGIYFLEY